MSAPGAVPALRVLATREGDTAPRVELASVPTPAIRPTDVEVAIQAVGLGGLERAIVRGERGAGGPIPRTLGWEAAGRIVTIGAEVDDWRPGDRVVLAPVRSCGRCGPCRTGRANLCPQRWVPGADQDGVAAGRVAVSHDALAPVPADLDDPSAALAAGSAATAYRALKQAGVHEGITLVVVGLGGLGLPAVALARLVGATVVGVDPNPIARDRAEAWGADAVVDATDPAAAEQVRESLEGGADRVLETAGRPDAAALAVRVLAAGGRAVFVGSTPGGLPPLALADLVATEVELVGSYGATLDDVGDVLDVVASGRLDLTPLVTATVGPDDAAEAVLALDRGDAAPPRTVLTGLTPD